FTSSNPKVAKVTAKGMVEAKKRGKAVITVRMKTSSAKCNVKVTVR
ncbi:MAG: Ig-like domain-containing protein, partial [Eubacterium sp.]|nr:Ig-like domain-containing protein [Eubacterium sp.]